MFWRVKYSKKGYAYVVTCLITLGIIVFTIPHPPKEYHSISIRNLHNEDLFYPLEQLVQDWTEPFITDIYISSDDTCTFPYTSIFNREWKGTRRYCQNVRT